jgi:hypothetical protein
MKTGVQDPEDTRFGELQPGGIEGVPVDTLAEYGLGDLESLSFRSFAQAIGVVLPSSTFSMRGRSAVRSVRCQALAPLR